MSEQDQNSLSFIEILSEKIEKRIKNDLFKNQENLNSEAYFSSDIQTLRLIKPTQNNSDAFVFNSAAEWLRARQTSSSTSQNQAFQTSQKKQHLLYQKQVRAKKQNFNTNKNDNTRLENEFSIETSSAPTPKSSRDWSQLISDMNEEQIAAFNFFISNEADFTRGLNDLNLKKAYRMLVMKVHPDRGGSSEAFSFALKAYETLKKYLSTKV